MAYDENIYARIINNQISEDEKAQLIQSGEWDEIQKILKVTEEIQLKPFDKEAAFQAVLTQGKNAQKGTFSIFRNRGFIGIAASVILLVAFLFVFNLNSKTEVTAIYTETKEIRLPDESTVRLNDGSSIKYKEKHWTNQRSIELMGEAVFDVTSGTSFQVTTANGSVTVLGTEFNVRSWGTNLYVECYEGKVRVNSGTQEQMLEAGTSVNISNGTMGAMKTIDHDAPLWTTGTSRFYEESLESVFQEIERQYDVRIEYPDVDRTFSGFFEHDDLAEALNQVCLPMDLNFEIKEGNKVEIKN